MGSKENKQGHEEYARNHQIQLITIVIFSVLVIVDVVLNFTTQVLGFIPLWIRGILSGIVIFFALVFIARSHKALFGSYYKSLQKPTSLVTDGIFDQVRHPMYLGVILLYFAFVVLSASLIGFGVWIAVIIIYYRLASEEEENLEDQYGAAYTDYKSKRNKFIPS